MEWLPLASLVCQKLQLGLAWWHWPGCGAVQQLRAQQALMQWLAGEGWGVELQIVQRETVVELVLVWVLQPHLSLVEDAAAAGLHA